MRILRTVVVGLGRIGWRYHLPRVCEHEGFDCVGAVDPLAERRDDALGEFGVRGFADLPSCLAETSPDLVVLASPTPYHREQAIQSFEAGCDVFCDKPMAGSLDEADAMVAAMRRCGRKLMMYQPHRVSRDVVALRRILGQGLIGPVYLIRHTRMSYNRRHDWQAFRQHGGGMLNNYGAHLIDACLYLADSRARRISCLLRSVASLGDADDVVRALIETESGVILDIDINQATAHTMPRWHVAGQHGSLVFDDEEQAWKARSYDPEQLARVETETGMAAAERRYGSGEEIPWQEDTFPVAQTETTEYYESCYQYFTGASEPLVPIEETRELMRVLDVCRKSDASPDWSTCSEAADAQRT